jgi:SAM-dependent methyltransferase
MKCRICKQDCLEIFVNSKCPKYSHKYLTSIEADSSFRLTVLRCLMCDTIQLADDLPPEEYADDYQRDITFSWSAQIHAKAYAMELTMHNPTSFIEIGCGSGMFSGYMKNMNKGMLQIAYEPSKAAYKKAKDRGLEVINDFYGEDAPDASSTAEALKAPRNPAQGSSYLPTAPYDSFAIRFVLEHLSDPVSLLRKLNAQLADGAIGLIEVPNADKQLREGRWHGFFREHTFYFTVRTLTNLLYRCGFDVVDLRTPHNEEFITVIVRKHPHTPMLIADHTFKVKTYAWGASGEAAVWLANTTGISLVIDSDREKQDMVISGCRLPILPPSILTADPPELLIITATAYKDEIFKQARKMGYTGKVLVFPNLEEMK